MNNKQPLWADEFLAGILNVRVSARQYYALKRLGDATGRGYGIIIRNLIDAYLREQQGRDA